MAIGWEYGWSRVALASALLCASACSAPYLDPPPHVAYPPLPLLEAPSDHQAPSIETKPAPHADEQPIDLTTALRLVDVQNPDVALTRERIREAFARQELAELYWVPTLSAQPNWMRHDGQIQRFNGEVHTISRSSAFAGGGVTVSFDVAEALYEPLATRQITAARSAAAAETANQVMQDAAEAYYDLLSTFALIQINEETLAHARRLFELTSNYQAVGKGAAADTERARTEVRMRERERIELQGRARIASARLARILLLPPEIFLKPVESAMIPVHFVSESIAAQELIAQALIHRPELSANRALIAAALERWRAAKITPLVPSLGVNMDAGGFGGGPNSYFGDFKGRSDFIAMAVWELRNMGLGDLAVIRERRSQYAQEVYRQSSLETRVASEVVAQLELVRATHQQMKAAQEAVRAASESYRLNEERIRRAPEQGRPIELLQAVHALNAARVDFLRVITEYNKSQFGLYTALGFPPLEILSKGVEIPLEVSTVPPEKPRDPARK